MKARLTSILLILLPWLVLGLGGLLSPGLLDDVDSVYTQIAREMLHRHDFITPTVDGVRFFDKPPLMYWLAAGSMRLFGEHDWAARMPLALGMLALLLAVYALGCRLYGHPAATDPVPPDRAGLYAALALATSLGPYLYTRFYIPDMLIALWMTLSVHLLLLATDRARRGLSTLWPALGFGAVMALDVLTKGLIGIVFPLGTALLLLALTRGFGLLRRLHLPAALAAFLAVAAPWHILAALRNPPVPMPPGLGLPARAGWAWFYLYNEHIARFLGRRIPHDYGLVPIPVFWLLLVLWLLPWAAFLPVALRSPLREAARTVRRAWRAPASASNLLPTPSLTLTAEGNLALLLWAGLVLAFFSISSRQEYYHLPALPALALLLGAFLARADQPAAAPAFQDAALPRLSAPPSLQPPARRAALRSALFVLVPLGSSLALVCGYFALRAPAPPPGSTLDQLLTANPALYTLSLGHVFDLTAVAMGFFRGPLLTVALGMLLLGPAAWLVRRAGHTLAANLLIAASMSAVLLAAHEGLVRFYPTLGSKSLALAIEHARRPGDRILLDGELTSGSTLLFYTGAPVSLVDGRINGPWFGSFFPDAPPIFLTDADLRRLWPGPRRLFLLTYHPAQRLPELRQLGPTFPFASAGGKTVLTNHP